MRERKLAAQLQPEISYKPRAIKRGNESGSHSGAG